MRQCHRMKFFGAAIRKTLVRNTGKHRLPEDGEGIKSFEQFQILFLRLCESETGVKDPIGQSRRFRPV